MCKILIVPKITKETSTNVEKFVKTMAPIISVGNSDGFGYAAIKDNGDIFSERWLVNSTAFTQPEPESDKLSALSSVLSKPKKELAYSSHGEVGLFSDMKAGVFHARMATCAKVLGNVHPFIKKDEDGKELALIHNGVIRNDSDFNLEQSTCDSEAALLAYHMAEVRQKPNSIQDMADLLRGYYAIGLLSSTVEGVPYVDVFNGNNERLAVAYIKELESLVFSTSGADIEEACKRLQFEIVEMGQIKDGSHIRILAGTNDVAHIGSFKPGPMSAEYKYNGNYSSGSRSYNPPTVDKSSAAKRLPDGVVTLLTEEEMELIIAETEIFGDWHKFA